MPSVMTATIASPACAGPLATSRISSRRSKERGRREEERRRGGRGAGNGGTALRVQGSRTVRALAALSAVRMDKSGGVLDRPITSPGRSSEFDLDTVKKKRRSPNYRVLLHNDDINRRDYVVKVLLKVIDGMAPDQAVNIMNHAHEYGMATVIVCGQDLAENYCDQLRSNGLISTIEPATDSNGSTT